MSGKKGTKDIDELDLYEKFEETCRTVGEINGKGGDQQQNQRKFQPLDDIKVGLGVLETSFQNKSERPVKALALEKVQQEPLPTAAQSNRLRIQDNTLFKLKQLFRNKLVSERDQLSQYTNQRSSFANDYQILPHQALSDTVKEQRPSYDARFKVQLEEIE